MLTRLSFMSSAFVTPGSPLKSSCASYPAQADVFFYAQGKNNFQWVINRPKTSEAEGRLLKSFGIGRLCLASVILWHSLKRYLFWNLIKMLRYILRDKKNQWTMWILSILTVNYRKHDICCCFVIRIDLSTRSLGDILWDEKDQWTGVCPVYQ